MTDTLEAAVIEAAGAVVERVGPEGVRIAVIYRTRYGGEWGLPKGKREPGESWQETARREVEEETGVSAAIVGIAGAAAYLAGGAPKLVLYWRMRVEGDVPPFAPNAEVAEVAWLPAEEAARRLTHPQEARIVQASAS